MTETPVTVLMPVYNAQAYLSKAIDSILRQTFGDFEFLIIDDGSTDDSTRILNSYRDNRIRIIYQENKGVAASLRLGVDLARGEYITRMDADDESLPDRLAIQKKVLDENPQGVLAYGLHDLIDEQGTLLRSNQGAGYFDGTAKWLLLWMNIFTHPTVMIRTRTLWSHQLNYRLETNGAEDFDLWNRLSAAGTFIFVPQVLIRYRLNSQSVNRINKGERQFRGYALVIKENFQRIGIPIAPELAEELVVISGQTPQNPLTYPYRYLPEALSQLMEKSSKKFSDLMAIDEKDLLPIQAEQSVRWARYLLHVSRKESFLLLIRALFNHIATGSSSLFWMTIAALLLLPKSTILRINQKRTQPLI
jgi:glycosyltransferase involved in cell wall biosynthesis